MMLSSVAATKTRLVDSTSLISLFYLIALFRTCFKVTSQLLYSLLAALDTLDHILLVSTPQLHTSVSKTCRKATFTRSINRNDLSNRSKPVSHLPNCLLLLNIKKKESAVSLGEDYMSQPKP